MPVAAKETYAATDTSAAYKRIFGKVTGGSDTTGIPGAIITVKGTQINTITNAEGKYSLNVPASANCTLLVSYIGYQRLETSIEVSKPSQQYNLNLKMNAALLGEVAIIRPSFAKRVYYNVTRPVRKLFRKKAKTVANMK
ncbi:carboxypeptidase-like regulatory domain-containing protein [Mucilaginibacter sp. HMF5004]|nr:carboxypeptidase-like regulatory domain-containing protein [Mucilaginibacter rivuli]